MNHPKGATGPSRPVTPCRIYRAREGIGLAIVKAPL